MSAYLCSDKQRVWRQMTVSFREKDDRYIVSCDRPYCLLNIAVSTLPAAVELEQHHECPFINGKSKYAWSITVQLVEQMWAKADEAYVELLTAKENHVENAVARWQGACRVAAELIALFMTPHFRTGDEVVREIVKRKEMKDKGEQYETPGLGYRIYELPRDEAKPRISKPAAERVAVPGKLTAEDIQMITFMKDAQPIKTIAELFDITVPEVEAVFRS